MTDPAWTSETLNPLNERFEKRSPREILQWAFETFGTDVVMATGFGPSGVVLMHLVSKLRPETTVFYLETDLLFPETHTLRELLAEQLGLAFTAVPASLSLQEQADAYGPALWERDPNQCCALRKTLPLRRFLSDKRAWITGLRRDQSPTRAETGFVEWDASNGLVKLNPLAAWTEDLVWQYIRFHELPYNSLHDEGYPSLGCVPCTRAVMPGEDPRAGRWPDFAKTECGIHQQPKAA